MKPRRFIPALSLKERLFQPAEQINRDAETLPPGYQREQFLKLAHDGDAARIDGWLTSPGLQPPK
jgi:hypothetical protein